MEHVEPVEINYTGSHGGVHQVHFCAHVNDKSSTFFSVPTLIFIADAILDGRCVPQFIIFVIPAWHFKHCKTITFIKITSI